MFPFCRLLFFSLFCLSITSVKAQQKELDRLFRDSAITGAQVGFSKNGKTTVYCFGNASTEEKLPVKPATVFQAASLSKVILAYVVLRAVDKGLLDLDKPLWYYLQNERMKSDTATQRITARMVLTHTSGLPNWMTNPTGKGWDQSPLAVKFPPGTGWSYSGEGFAALQQVVEQLTGKPLPVLAGEEVFRPLGMAQSSFSSRTDLDKLTAFGHDSEGNENPRIPFYRANAAYSLVTTAVDYNRFLQALIGGKGLSPQTFAAMLQPLVTPQWFGRPASKAATHLHWGLGVGLTETKDGTAIWHWGDNGDFKSFFFANSKTGESLVCFTNSENGLKAMSGVFRLFFGAQTCWPAQWLKE